MKTILSKSIEAKLKDRDKSILKDYWSLLFGKDYAEILVFEPNVKPKKKKKDDSD